MLARLAVEAGESSKEACKVVEVSALARMEDVSGKEGLEGAGVREASKIVTSIGLHFSSPWSAVSIGQGTISTLYMIMGRKRTRYIKKMCVYYLSIRMKPSVRLHYILCILLRITIVLMYSTE